MTWPTDKPLPNVHLKVRRRARPCPKCRKTKRPEGGAAVRCTSSGDAIAFYRCHCCGHKWQLPVEYVG